MAQPEQSQECSNDQTQGPHDPQAVLREHRNSAPKFEELYSTVQENAIAFALSPLAYMKDQGQSAAGLIASAGKRLAPSWQILSNQGARTFAQNIALNITALGGKPMSIEGDRTHAEVIFRDWIHVEHARSFGLNQQEADSWWDVFEPIASSMNLHYTWRREDEQIIIEISQ